MEEDPVEVLKEFARQRQKLENWIALARRAHDWDQVAELERRAEMLYG